ncbi:MAG: DUF3793 family protein [bacterium]|nr:DUF3793 family protein [bacterium]
MHLSPKKIKAGGNVKLEKQLIEYCSPTLASLKTASLFRLSFSAKNELDAQIERWNRQLSEKGISVILLKQWDKNALVYVCRKSHLELDLKKEGVSEFLHRYGYEQSDVEYTLERLKSRLKESEEFPHEIGVFLGYPLGDVIGFIENAGKNSKCTGCWKVYCNECEAQKMFARFKKCKDIYERLWNQGRTIWQLTVAA